MNVAVEGGAQAIAPRIRAPAAMTNTAASFAELLPQSRNLNYILLDFTTIKSHPAGLFMVPTTTAQITMMTSAGRTATVIGDQKGTALLVCLVT